MSEKILITSIGRTGTLSLSHFLDAFAAIEAQHERGADDPSFLFLSQHTAYSAFTRNYLQERDAVATASDKDYYIEVNPYFRFADTELLQSLGWSIIYLVRHPKTYLESVYKRNLFTPQDKLPQQLPDRVDPIFDKWSSSSRFHKLCWYYWKAHQHFLAQGLPIYKYEDLISGQQALQKLLQEIGLEYSAADPLILPHMNRAGAIPFKQRLKQFIGLGRSGQELIWEDLTAEDHKAYDRYCKPLIHKLGYELP